MSLKPFNKQEPNHLVNILALVVIGYAIHANYGFINQMLLAIVVAIILNPLIKFLNKLHIPFFLSLIIIIGGVSLVISLIGAVIASTVNQFMTNIQAIVSTAVQKFEDLQAFVQPILEFFGFNYDLSSLTKNFDTSWLWTLVSPIIASLTNMFGTGFFIFLTVVFILIDTDLLKSKFNYISQGNSERVASVASIFTNVSKYIEKKFVISLVTALVVYGVCNIFGLRFALMWAVLTLFFNFIPNIGVFIVSAPMILQAFILNSFYTAIGFSVSLVIVHFLSGNVFEPRVMSKYLNLGNFVVWVSLIFWNEMLGPIGMLLSVPLTTTCKIMLEMSTNYKGLAVLMSGDDSHYNADDGDKTLEELAAQGKKDEQKDGE